MKRSAALNLHAGGHLLSSGNRLRRIGGSRSILFICKNRLHEILIQKYYRAAGRVPVKYQ